MFATVCCDGLEHVQRHCNTPTDEDRERSPLFLLDVRHLQLPSAARGRLIWEIVTRGCLRFEGDQDWQRTR
jgi:hypothetical protein